MEIGRLYYRRHFIPVARSIAGGHRDFCRPDTNGLGIYPVAGTRPNCDSSALGYLASGVENRGKTMLFAAAAMNAI